jgi:DNA modification methylase
MEVNKIHNINFLDNTLPDKCANLIIADPPYFEVKGAFDFIWSDMKAYLKDVEKWAIECKRLLADNGTLFWYGHAKNIAYAQVIFDEHFDLINNIVWDKGSFMGLEESEGIRSFAPCTERILMYTNETYNLTQCVSFIRDYIRGEIEKSKGKIVLKEVNEALGTATNGGGVASACLSLDKAEPTMLTKEMYEKLQDWCKPFLTTPYELLRAEYELLRRPFNNQFKLQEIVRYSNEASKTGAKYDHDTVKPETLTRALILTCSRPNDLVVVPFAGSGTECAMSVKEGRKTIGFEITEKHAKMSNDRVQNILRQPSLFVGS